DRVRLAVFDADDGLFRLIADDAPVGHEPSAVAIRDTAWAADVLAGREHLAADLETERGFRGEAGLLADGLRSSGTLPLRATNHAVGGLRLAWRQPLGYRVVNIASLAQIADAMALALEKSRLLQETQRRADELAMLVSISATLRVSTTTEEVM